MKTRSSLALATALATFALGGGAAHGALISYTGSTYSQNFNSLVASGTDTWTNGSTIEGWFWGTTNSTPITPTTQEAANGATGKAGGTNVLSLAHEADPTPSDRAFGAASNSSPDTRVYGAGFVNNSGSSFGSFNLSYHGEQYRVVGGESAETLQFQYQVFAAGTGSLTAATGWTTVGSLGFTTPVTGGVSGAVNGNVEGGATISGSANSVAWAAGTELWIRWLDGEGSNSRHIIGIDDVSFTAVPESSAGLLLGASTLGLGLIRRRRK